MKIPWLKNREKKGNVPIVRDVFSVTAPRSKKITTRAASAAPSEKNVLDLKKKPPLISLHLPELERFFQSNKRPILTVVSLILCFSVLASFFRSYASIATFYPKTCLGGWQNPEYATGEPTLGEDASQTDFNHENSAYTKNQAVTLYCGDFTGTIPEDTQPKHFALSFSWSVDNGTIVHSEPTPFDVTPESAGGAGAPTPTVPDAATDSSLQNTPSIDTLLPDVPASSPATVPESAPAPVPESAPADSSGGTTSFLQKMFGTKVFAQDADAVQVIEGGESIPSHETPVSTPPPAPTVEPSPLPSTPSADATPAPTASSDSSVSNGGPLPSGTSDYIDNASLPKGASPLPVAPATNDINSAYNPDKADGFLEVMYTLDGTKWNDLGSVSQNAWHGASFEIPLTGWDDLSHFQIALKTLPTVDSSPAVYLDSLRLDVAYDDLVEKVTPPTIILKDSTDVISGDGDFTSIEDPSFIVTDPGFSTFDVNKLVQQKKADVVEDPSDVIPSGTPGDKTINTATGILNDVKNILVGPSADTPTDTPSPAPVAPPTDASGAIDVSAPSASAPTGDSSPAPPHASASDTDGKPTSFLQILKPTIAHADDTDPTPPLEASVLDVNGAVTDIPVSVDTTYVLGKQKNVLHIHKPERSFRPGRYTIRVKMYTPTAVVITEQDFTWGVLAVNVDRTIYRPGDEALVQFGVLLDSGDTVCDADIEFSIKDPIGGSYNFTTADGSIVRDTKCGPNNVIDVPDYYAHFPVPNLTGTYTMTATSHTASGTRTINDHFEVRSSVDFDVERVTATRIYPGSSYPVVLSVTPTADWSGTITEQTPASFKISEPSKSQKYDSAVTVDDTTTISWNVNLKAGETTKLGYVYLAPFISPEFYLLGKAAFVDASGVTVFTETRNWQIASDAACNAVTTGLWAAASTWSGCTGVGGIPAAADTVTINANVIVTVNANASVAGITFANPVAVGANSIVVNTGVTLTDTGGMTFNGNTGTLNQTLQIDGTGIVNVSGALNMNTAPTSSGSARVIGGASPTTCSLNVAGATSMTNATTAVAGAAIIDLSLCTSTTSAFTTGSLSITGNTTGTGITTVKISGGSITSGSITGAGVAGKMLITTTAATAVINLAGSTISGVAPTLTLQAGTLTKFTGTNAINLAFTTWKNWEVVSGTTTLGAVQTVTGLQVDSGATLAGSTFLLTNTCTSTGVAGFYIDGTYSGSGGVTLSGSGCTLDGTGNVTNTGTFTLTNNKTIASTASLTVGGSTSAAAISAATTVTNNGSFTFAGTGAVTGRNASTTIWTNATGTSVLTVKSGTTTFLATGVLTVTTAGNIVNYAGAAQTCKVTTYSFIELSGSGAKTCAPTAVNSLIIGDGVSTQTWTAGAISLAGTLTVNSGSMTKGAAALTVSGATTINGGSLLSSSATGTATFTGLVTVNGGSFNLSGAATATSFAGGVTVNSGATTFNTGSGACSFITNNQIISGTATIGLTFGATTLTTTNITLTNNYASGGTVTFATLSLVSPSGTYGVSLSGSTATVVTGLLNFASNGTGGANTEAVTLNGSATLTAGSVTMAAPTTTIGGAKEGILAANGAAGSVTVTGATSITGGATGGQFCGIDVSAGGTTTTDLTLGATTISGGATGVAGVFINSGNLTFKGALAGGGTTANAQLTTGTNTTLFATGSSMSATVVTLSITNTTFNTSGTVTLSGAYNGANSLPNLNVLSGTTTMGAVAITISGATNVAGTLTNSTGAQVKTFNGLVTVKSGGSFTLNTSTVPLVTFGGGIRIDQGATAFTVGGAVTFSATQSIDDGTGTPTLTPLTFAGASSISSGATLTNSYNGGTVIFTGLMTVNVGNTGLTLSTGSVTTNAGGISFTGNSTAGSAQLVDIQGNADYRPGAITMNATTSTGTAKIQASSTPSGTMIVSGTVLITGSSSASGGLSSIDFSGTSKNFTVGTLTVTGGTVSNAQVIMGSGTISTTVGAITLNGAASGSGLGTLTSDTGIIDANFGITFGGTVILNGRLITTNNATIQLTGAMSGLGTLSFAGGTSFTTNGTASIAAAYTLPNLTVTSGTTTLNNVVVTINGPTTVAGILQNATGGTAKIFVGLVEVQSGATFNMAVPTAAAPEFRGGIQIDAGATAFSAGGAVSFTTNSQSITQSGSGTWPPLSFGATTIPTSTITLTNSYTGGNVTFASLTLSSPTSAAYGFDLDSGTNTTVTGTMLFTANSSAGGFAEAVTMSGSANLTLGALTMPAITSTAGGTETIIGASTPTGTLTVTGTTAITGSSTIGGGLVSIDFTGSTANVTLGVTNITGGTQSGGAKILMGTGTLTTSGLLTLTGGTVGVASVTSNAGMIDINTGLTFATTLAQAQLITTGAATINLTGTMQGLGVLNWSAGTSFITVGTTSISSAYTIPAVSTFSVTAGVTTIAAAVSSSAPITVSSGGTMSFGVASGAIFTASSTTTVAGTINCITTSGFCQTAKKFVGNISISTGGVFDLTNAVGTAPTVEFRSGIDMNGTTFTPGNGAVTFTTNNQDITGTAGIVAFDGSVTINTPIVVTNKWETQLTNSATLVGTGTWAQFASTDSILDVDSVSPTITTFNATPAGNIVDYRANSQSPRATTYDTLRISNGNGSPQADSISGATIVVQTLFDIAANTELDMYSGGVLTMNAGSTIQGASSTTSVIQPQTGTSTINCGATTLTNFDYDATTVGTSTPVFIYNNTSAGQTIFPTTYYDLTTTNTGQTATLGGTTTVLHAITNTTGTFDTGSQTLSAQTMSIAGGLTLGSSTVTLTGTGTVFSRTAGTVSAGTSTITLSDTSNTAKTFAGGGQTYNNLLLTPGTATGASLYTISGSNTFNDFQDTGTGSHGFKFTTGTTTTVATFTVTGSPTNTITIDSTTTGTHSLVKTGGGTISTDYMNIQHSVATPASTWYAGTHSTNNQGVTTAGSGWLFTSPVGPISISGTGSASNSGATVRVAVNGVLQAQTGTVTGGGTWTIAAVPAPTAGDVMTVWVDAVADSNESTAVTVWTAGNISGMDLSLDTLTVGSNQNTALTLADLGQYTCASDEDVMQSVASSVLRTQGTSCAGGATQSYTDPALVILSNNALTVGTTETAITGLLNINASATLTATGSANIELTSATGTLFTNSGTFTPNSSTVLFSGNGSATLVSATTAFFNLSSSGTGTKSAGAALTINGLLDITGGEFNPAGNVITSGGTATISVSGSGQLDIDGATFAATYSGFTPVGTTLLVGSIVAYNAGGTQTVASTLSYSNLIITGAGTKSLSGPTTVGQLTMLSGPITLDTTSGNNWPLNTATLMFQGGTLTANGSIITLSGTNGNPLSYISGTFNSGTSTVNYTGNNPGGNTTINTSVTYNNLTVNNAVETYTISTPLTIPAAGTLTVLDGTFDDVNLNVSTGHLSIGNPSTAIFLAHNASVTISGTTGTLLSIGATGVFTAGTSTVTVSGNGTTSLSSGSFTGSSAFATLTSSGTGTKTMGGDIEATTTININTGTIDTGGFDLTSVTLAINGTARLNATGSTTITLSGTANPTFTKAAGATFDTSVGSSTVNMTGDVTPANLFSGTFTGANSFYNLSFTPTIAATRAYTVSFAALATNGGLSIIPNSGPSRTYTLTLSSSLTNGAAGTLTVDGTGAASGILDTNGNTMSLGSVSIGSSGTITANASAITVAGDWSNSGTFTPGTSSVTMNTGTTANVSGSTTFYDYTITHSSAKQVNFAASGGTPTYTVSHTFTITGHAGALIALRSASSPTKWDFLPSGTATVDYADVEDGGCHVGAITMAPTNSVDSGNNDPCWGFAPILTFSNNAASIGLGTLISASTRYATTGGGSGTDAVAHTLNIVSSGINGYTLSVKGTPPTATGGHALTPATNIATGGTPGTEQFAISGVISGTGTMVSGYNHTNWSFVSGTTTTIASSSAPAAGDTIDMHYQSNISPTTPAGSYSGAITYILTGNF